MDRRQFIKSIGAFAVATKIGTRKLLVLEKSKIDCLAPDGRLFMVEVNTFPKNASIGTACFSSKDSCFYVVAAVEAGQPVWTRFTLSEVADV
jgi:hypothetical protein